jgi:hypothetical protein
VIVVEECDGVAMPGLWISGEALHDLHQAYLMEKAKRERLESAIDLMEQVEKVYEAGKVAHSNGALWAWIITWGAVTFTGGFIFGLTFDK